MCKFDIFMIPSKAAVGSRFTSIEMILLFLLPVWNWGWIKWVGKTHSEIDFGTTSGRSGRWEQKMSAFMIRPHCGAIRYFVRSLDILIFFSFSSLVYSSYLHGRDIWTGFLKGNLTAEQYFSVRTGAPPPPPDCDRQCLAAPVRRHVFLAA